MLFFFFIIRLWTWFLYVDSNLSKFNLSVCVTLILCTLFKVLKTFWLALCASTHTHIFSLESIFSVKWIFFAIIIIIFLRKSLVTAYQLFYSACLNIISSCCISNFSLYIHQPKPKSFYLLFSACKHLSISAIVFRWCW